MRNQGERKGFGRESCVAAGRDDLRRQLDALLKDLAMRPVSLFQPPIPLMMRPVRG